MRILTTALLIALFLGFEAPSFAQAEGKAAYTLKCKVCHAEDGTGNPSIAKLNKIDPVLLDLTTEKSKKISDAKIEKVVRKGQNKMKPILSNKMSDEDLRAAISHVRVLQKAKK